MKRNGAVAAMATMLSMANSGCGTLLNVGGTERLEVNPQASVVTADGSIPEFVPKYARPPFPFGGVSNDVAWIKSAEQPIDVVGSVVDMPFSFVGDFVTLPWTTYLWLGNGVK
jgi:uncharacterized protein YceK